MQLYSGLNVLPVTQKLLAPGAGTRPFRDLLGPLIDSGTLDRVWWLDSRTQDWKFFDPNPELAPFNTLTMVNLAANPPVVLVISVSSQTEFWGQTLYSGSNYVVMR